MVVPAIDLSVRTNKVPWLNTPASASFFFACDDRCWPQAAVRHSRVVERYWMTAYERIADLTSSSAALPRGGGYRPRLSENSEKPLRDEKFPHSLSP